jgi:hypothetical protein
MRKLTLTQRQLAFLVVTRALLAAGIGLLASRRVPPRLHRPIGLGLVAVGAVTTVPAVRMLAASA